MRVFYIFLVSVFLTAFSNAELRTWTAVNGKKVEAQFVSNVKGIVKLRLKSGKLFEVPKDKLSKEDNEFIVGLYKAEVVVGSGKKDPKPIVPVNLDQYRDAIADSNNRTEKKFEEITLEIFHYQIQKNRPSRRFS